MFAVGYFSNDRDLHDLSRLGAQAGPVRAALSVGYLSKLDDIFEKNFSFLQYPFAILEHYSGVSMSLRAC